MNSPAHHNSINALPHQGAPVSQRGNKWLKRACIALAIISLVGCGSMAQVTTGTVAEIALGAVGIKLPGSQQTKTVALRVEGAQNLNAGSDGQGLATVIRLYKLRNQHTFLAAPYASFDSPEMEKMAIGTDLIEVRELILSPGQVLNLTEKMNGEANYLGVVTLFRAPYPRRWRFAFATAEAADNGITLGVHSCAMTATSTPPIGLASGEAAMLSTVSCQ